MVLMIFLPLLGFQVTLSLVLTSVAIVIVIKTQCKSKIVILSNSNHLDHKLSEKCAREQWWRGGERTRLSRTWPWFDFETWRHMW